MGLQVGWGLIGRCCWIIAHCTATVADRRGARDLSSLESLESRDATRMGGTWDGKWFVSSQLLGGQGGLRL